MSSWTAASSDCSRPVNNYVHVKTADLYRPNARLTPERQGYQVLTPFGKLGYSHKIDVDGIEHLILSGGRNILQRVTGILIEINEDFTEQLRNSDKYLTRAGLSMTDKRHFEVVAGSVFQPIFNQIWTRHASCK